MSITELLKKVANGDELTDEERAEIASYQEPDPSDAIGKVKKIEREKAQKREAELSAELESLREQIDDMETGTNKADQLAKKIERLEKKHKEALDRFEAEATAHRGTKRDIQIENLLNKHTWVDGEARNIAKSALQEKLKDVDDLSDATETDPALAGLVDSDFGKRLIMARSSGGSGSEGSSGVNPGSTATFSIQQIQEMTPDEFKENEAAILKAEREGRIK